MKHLLMILIASIPILVFTAVADWKGLHIVPIIALIFGYYAGHENSDDGKWNI